MVAHVLYAYYQNEEQEQNFLYFLNTGIIANPDVAKYYFLITCTSISERVQLALRPHQNSLIYVEKCQTDATAWSHAINNVVVHNEGDTYFFINSTCRGPFMPVYMDKSWIAVLNNMFDEVSGVQLVCPVMEVPPDNNIPFAHTYMFGLSYKGMRILQKRGLWKVYNKHSAVIEFERNVSRHILQTEGMNMKSLMLAYQNVDWRKKANWDYKIWRQWAPVNTIKVTCPETPNNYYGIDLHPLEVMFMKNIRLCNEMRPENMAGFLLDKEVQLYSEWACR